MTGGEDVSILQYDNSALLSFVIKQEQKYQERKEKIVASRLEAIEDCMLHRPLGSGRVI